MEHNPDSSLADLVLQALETHPSGISEYELIQWLKNTGHEIFQNVTFWDRLSLFQAHFILFHTLYRLKQRCWEHNQTTLDINPLKIVLLPARKNAGSSIAEHDPLMDYYLDVDNLKNTSENDVAELLTNFWKTLSNKDKRSAALKELELSDPVDYVKIKRQHRRLVMRHHPDRGGKKEKLQTINAAMDFLHSLYNPENRDGRKTR